MGIPYWSTATSAYLVVPIVRTPSKDPVIDYLGFVSLPCLILLTTEWSGRLLVLETNGRNSRSHEKLYDVGESHPCLPWELGADTLGMSPVFEVTVADAETSQSLAHQEQGHCWLWKSGESQTRGNPRDWTEQPGRKLEPFVSILVGNIPSPTMTVA